MIRLPTNKKLAIARTLRALVISVRRIVGRRGPIALCHRNGIRWKLDLDEGIDLAIYIFTAFELSTARAIREFLEPGMTVLDIGANIGAHALPMGREVGPEGKVYAIEPTAKAHARLLENLDLNPNLRGVVVPIRAALIEKGGKKPAAFYSSWALNGKGERHALHGGVLCTTEGADFTTLDDLVNRLGLEKIDFMKIDVDGFECKILRGAQKTLKKFHPALVLELCPYALAETGDSFAELLELLRHHGYQLYTEDQASRLPDEASAIERLIPKGGSLNAFAISKQSP